MLEEFTNAIYGPITTAAFTNPAGYGIRTVPRQAGFAGVFNRLLSSFSPNNGFGIPQLGYGGNGIGGIPFQGYGGGIGPQALQAFNGSRGQFSNTPERTIRNQALAPGAVVINSKGVPVISPQVAPQGGFSPNDLLGLSPLQGFAGQGGGVGGNYGYGQFGGAGVPLGGSGYVPGQNGFGPLSLLIFPIISLFSIVKSLLGFRRTLGSLKPVKVDPYDLSYYNYKNYIEEQYEEGNFDEPDPYEPNSFREEYSLNSLQDF